MTTPTEPVSRAEFATAISRVERLLEQQTNILTKLAQEDVRNDHRDLAIEKLQLEVSNLKAESGKWFAKLALVGAVLAAALPQLWKRFFD